MTTEQMTYLTSGLVFVILAGLAYWLFFMPTEVKAETKPEEKPDEIVERRAGVRRASVVYGVNNVPHHALRGAYNGYFAARS